MEGEFFLAKSPFAKVETSLKCDVSVTCWPGLAQHM